jgi:uncharacterized protein YndB with AHSA1/START domain
MTDVNPHDAGASPGGAQAGAQEDTESNALSRGSVELSIFIQARPETVFSILTEPERLGAWMNGAAAFEPSVGSAFSIRFPQFDTVVAGEVLELVLHKRVAFSWGVSEGPQAETVPAGSTRVEFALVPEGEGTRLTLTHSGFEMEEERVKHEAGWRFHGSRLSLLANRADLTAAMGRLAEAYFGAWNEMDAEARAKRLEACCSEDVAFKDEYAALEGRNKLSLHIGNTQKYQAGVLVQDGDVVICRGEALLPWKIVDEEGRVAYRGMNHMVVAPQGLVRRVTGFWSV